MKFSEHTRKESNRAYLFASLDLKNLVLRVTDKMDNSAPLIVGG